MKNLPPQAVILICAAIWILYGFGYETVWRRLTTELDGVVIKKWDLPRSPWVHGVGTVYVLRGPGGGEVQYISGATDASLPHDIPVGAHLVKNKWELSYIQNDQRQSDFPLYAYSGMFGIALSCLMWAALIIWRRRKTAAL